MEWYQRWFGEEYLLVYEHRDLAEAERDIHFVERILHLRSGERVLDLCCGPGRHDPPLARLGCRVIGLDYSICLLRAARAALGPDDANPCYVRADAREIPFRDGVFDVILNLFTSFGYFEDGGNCNLLCSMARLLRPEGRYCLDYLNPPLLLAGLVPETKTERNGVTVIERRALNDVKHRVEKTIILRSDGREETFRESIRLYPLAEMLIMLRDAGLTVEGVFGSTEGEEYTESSPRMILWGRKHSPPQPPL